MKGICFGKDSMFYSEFFRGVAYYINDPKTWINFTLTCKYFSQLNKEFSPLKKNEFRVSIREWISRFTLKIPDAEQLYFPTNIDIPLVLPNGTLHGYCEILDSEFTTRTSILKTGFLTYLYPYEVKNVEYRFIRERIVRICDEYTMFVNYCDFPRIYAYKCSICNKKHFFYSTGTECILLKNCFDTEFHFQTSRWNFFRRQKITKSILDYAKIIKNNNVKNDNETNVVNSNKT